MDRAAKLNALRNIAVNMGDPSMISILSFLAGRLDSVHFVPEVEDADVWVHLSVNTRLWPRIPFRARIEETAVNNPITFIDLEALRDDEIYVRADFAGEPPKWYQDVLEEDLLTPREALEASIDRIREKIDLALDAYKTASETYPEASEEDRRYLSYVLEKAKDEMRALNAQLNELEKQVGWIE